MIGVRYLGDVEKFSYNVRLRRSGNPMRSCWYGAACIHSMTWIGCLSGADRFGYDTRLC